MTDVLAFGETMLVLRTVRPGRLAVRDRLEVGAAGAESNVAIGLARLGHDVQLVGVVGDDDAGAAVLSAVRAEGVRWAGRIDPDGPDRVAAADRPRSVVVPRRLLPPRVGGRPPLAGRPRRSAGRRTTRRAHERRHGCVGRRSPGPRSSPRWRSAELASYDVNFRSRLTSRAAAAEVLAEVLPSLHVLFCGEDELPVLAAALGRRDLSPAEALELDVVPELVIKSGARGAACRAERARYDVAAHAVEVVDEVGAGDAFAAGYLSALLDALAPADRLARGALVAAYCVAGVGDTDTLPTRADLDHLPATRITVR